MRQGDLRSASLAYRLAWLVVLALVGVLSACGGNATGQGSVGNKVNVVIGYENNGADPYMISMAKGYFQKYMPGANVQLKFFDSGPAALSALASNNLQFMTGLGVPPFVAAISQGLPLQIIWNQERYTQDAGIVARPGTGINSIKDLQNRSIAIVVGSQASFELATFLQQAGVPYDSVRQLNMSPPAMRVAWQNKSIDAAIVWDPVFDALRKDGGIVIATDADLPPAASSYNITVVNSDWAKGHKDIVKGFIKAMDMGVTYYNQNPDDALRVMAKAASIDVDTAKTEIAGYQIYTARDQLNLDVLGQGPNVARSATTQTLAATATVLRKIGRIQGMPDNFSKYVDSSYVAATLSQ